MRAVAKAVAPGSYRLEWVVLSVDGHITRGNVMFKVDATGR
jgi:methionine-rich copper-binding protein CopC